MEPSDEKEKEGGKKINDDVVLFLTKRSETDAPRYTARLKDYVALQHKRRRAATVRRRLEQGSSRVAKTSKRKPEPNKETAEATEFQGNEVRRRRSSRSASQSGSVEPGDACGCRRRRRRRRRRSCGRRRVRRRRRRRRSCSRRRRRRRRRSCSRRRRRRSCGRRRRRRRRRRC